MFDFLLQLFNKTCLIIIHPNTLQLICISLLADNFPKAGIVIVSFNNFS